MPLKLKILKIDSTMLSQLSPSERLLLFQLGRLANDLNSLSKFFIFVQPSGPSSPEQRAAGFQRLMLTRLTAAKLWEGWMMLQANFFAAKLSRGLELRMVEEASSALSDLKKYFGQPDNLLKRIRDKFEFHYDSETLKALLEEHENYPEFYMYLATSSGNALYAFSDELAVLGLVDGVDAEAINALYAEIFMNLTPKFVLVSEHLMIGLVGQWWGDLLNRRDPEDLELTVPSVNDVRVPFFIERGDTERV